MLKKVLRGLIILVGAGLGPLIAMGVHELIWIFADIDYYKALILPVNAAIFGGSALITGIIAFIYSKRIAEKTVNIRKRVEKKITTMAPGTIVFGFLGAILGLVAALLISGIIKNIQVVWLVIPLEIIVYLALGSFGLRMGIRNSEKILTLFRDARQKNRQKTVEELHISTGACPKILDTSAIIDGRIFDVLKTGVIEGTLIIPEFVLDELRHIADSADGLKRGKGRRGLDILNKIQKELSVAVEIYSGDYEELYEVDAKLIRLAKDMDGKVITNDFNLNKVAAVQGVPVLNINELANAVKPVLLPGEIITTTILKEGKEYGQGVAYLQDGTMIVVENGRSHIGETLELSVTSVLQTAAGRMIFAKCADD